jgi:hypothetical protein
LLIYPLTVADDVPVRTLPTFKEPDPTAVTFNVVPEIDPVNDVPPTVPVMY